MTTAGKCWSWPTWRTAEKGGLDKGWLQGVIFLLKTINLFPGLMMVSLRIGGDQQKNITGYFEFVYKIMHCPVFGYVILSLIWFRNQNFSSFLSYKGVLCVNCLLTSTQYFEITEIFRIFTSYVICN